MSNKKIVKHTSDELRKMKDASDWDRAAGMTDEEIEAADAQDPEVAGIDDAWMDKAEVVRSPKKTVYAVFDAYVMVDWSAESRPKTGADSIWWMCLERGAHGLEERAAASPSGNQASASSRTRSRENGPAT